jgi:hypothetical protein
MGLDRYECILAWAVAAANFEFSQHCLKTPHTGAYRSRLKKDGSRLTTIA